MQSTVHIYEVRPCKDKRGVDLISYLTPVPPLWGEVVAMVGVGVGASRMTFGLLLLVSQYQRKVVAVATLE